MPCDESGAWLYFGLTCKEYLHEPDEIKFAIQIQIDGMFCTEMTHVKQQVMPLQQAGSICRDPCRSQQMTSLQGIEPLLDQTILQHGLPPLPSPSSDTTGKIAAAAACK